MIPVLVACQVAKAQEPTALQAEGLERRVCCHQNVHFPIFQQEAQFHVLLGLQEHRQKREEKRAARRNFGGSTTAQVTGMNDP